MVSPAPIRPTPSDVQVWRDALEAMKPTVPPCPGLSALRWQEMREAAIDFLDRFGEDAIAFGWTATDLFGVHPTVGVVRVDYCGALILTIKPIQTPIAKIDWGHRTPGCESCC
ncbi:hypothetical protein [Methylobacterium sp. J-092]|uniref:hypothetical protein n=1 Tax=Methylobacterium sp. J-092 TaxID=2836667 RepID=UPI001FB93595|nr:hypothetical protein [Methylobacterium sp. J-092]MCJ2006629.1 hypothetical protein [Methylobacterium sp. J-092]